MNTFSRKLDDTRLVVGFARRAIRSIWRDGATARSSRQGKTVTLSVAFPLGNDVFVDLDVRKETHQ